MTHLSFSFTCNGSSENCKQAIQPIGAGSVLFQTCNYQTAPYYPRVSSQLTEIKAAPFVWSVLSPATICFLYPPFPLAAPLCSETDCQKIRLRPANVPMHVSSPHVIRIFGLASYLYVIGALFVSNVCMKFDWDASID